MHARVIGTSIMGTTLATAGAIVAFVLAGSGAYIPGWPSLGVAGWLFGGGLLLVGLLGPAVSLRWVLPDRSVLDGAMSGLLTAVTPAYLVVMPWLGLLWSESGRLQAETAPLEGLPFARLLAEISLSVLFWSPVAAAVLVLTTVAVAGCITGVLGARLIHSPRPMRLSWFPTWVVYIASTLLVVQINALSTLGGNISQVMDDQAALVRLAIDMMPLTVLLIEAIAVGIAARQVPAAWSGGDRLGAIVIASSITVLWVGQLGAVGLVNPTWMIPTVIAPLAAAGIGLGVARLDDASVLERGAEPLAGVALRTLGLSVIGTILIMGPGSVTSGLVAALAVVPMIGTLAGGDTPAAEVRAVLTEFWPWLAYGAGLTFLAVGAQFAVGMAIRWAVRRAIKGRAQPPAPPRDPENKPSSALYVAPPVDGDPFAPPGY